MRSKFLYAVAFFRRLAGRIFSYLSMLLSRRSISNRCVESRFDPRKDVRAVANANEHGKIKEPKRFVNDSRAPS